MGTIRKIFFGVYLLLLSCSSSTEPSFFDPSLSDNYVDLKIGDKKQMHVVGENSYFLTEVTGKTTRIDGREVFVQKHTMRFPNEELIGEMYNYISNGYFIRTELDTVNQGQNKIRNPFNEQKLCKVLPVNGDEFVVNEFSDYADIYKMKVEIIDSFETELKTFKDVVAYRQYKNGFPDGNMIYYAKGYGHIGSVLANNGAKIKIVLNYIKTGRYEKGNLIGGLNKIQKYR